MSFVDNQKFQALKYPLQISAPLGRYQKERDYSEHIKGMIVQILMTAPAERLHRARFGAGLKSFVFAPLYETSARLIEARVLSELEEWLGNYIVNIDVKTRTERENTLIVEIYYVLRDTRKTDILTFKMEL